MMGMAKTALLRPFHAATAAAHEFPYFPFNQSKFYSQNFRHLLSSCKNLNSLLQIHGRLVVSGIEKDQFIATHLINSYSLFGKCDLARIVFDSLLNPCVIVWNSVIRAYTKSKKYKEALKIYHYMLDKGLEPDKYSFTFALKACTGALDLLEGLSIQSEIARRKLDYDVFIGTGLVDMHSKMGNLRSAVEVFDRMLKRDIVAWNAIIGGLSQSCDPFQALEYFRMMQMEDIEPNMVSLLNLVPAVSKLADIESCKSIHGYVIRRDLSSVVSNALIDMYSKCGDIRVARLVFDLTSGRDNVSWGTMMAGYVYNGILHEVLHLFDSMKTQSLRMNKVCAVNSILAAGEMTDLDRGQKIHDCASQQGVNEDIVFSTSVITMYVKCGELQKAKELFEKLHNKDVIAWSALISVCSQSGYYKEALSLFRDMQSESLRPDLATTISIVSVCGELALLNIGKSIHGLVIKANIDSDISLGTALVSMYVKCGSFALALNLFNRMPCKDIVTWNALINGYSQIGDPYHTFLMFHKLQLSEVQPDAGTMVALLSVCGLTNDHLGSCIHGQITKRGFESDCYIKSALIHMHAKCGNLLSVEILFKRNDFVKDVISWNAVIAGYLQNGHIEEAMSSFLKMKLENFHPNLVTFVSILPAAASLADLRVGMGFHSSIIKMGFLSNILIGNSLIDMYAKCGRLDYSKKCFNEMENKNTVSWNAMLAGYAVHGQGDSAVALFSLMQMSQVPVDSVTFLNVLSACRHAGLVRDGKRVFQSMWEEHHTKPKTKHYACMVDLLGRAGLFEETLVLMDIMPMEPDAAVWGALLGACRMHSNIELAEIALNQLVKLEPKNSTNYVVISSLYAESGRGDDELDVRSQILDSGLKKTPGSSWV